MLRDLMTSWHLNIWKIKVWLSQEQKELSTWNKKHFSLFSQFLSFRLTKQTSKNVADTTFNFIMVSYLGFILVVSKWPSNWKKNPEQPFIQLQPYEQWFFCNIKKINNEIAAAASYCFFLGTCTENLITLVYKAKIIVYILSLSQLLHDEQNKHVREVAAKNMKTD